MTGGTLRSHFQGPGRGLQGQRAHSGDPPHTRGGSSRADQRTVTGRAGQAAGGTQGSRSGGCPPLGAGGPQPQAGEPTQASEQLFPGSYRGGGISNFRAWSSWQRDVRFLLNISAVPLLWCPADRGVLCCREHSGVCMSARMKKPVFFPQRPGEMCVTQPFWGGESRG